MFSGETCIGVGDDIRRCRIALGLSQHELARVLGVHKNTVSNWERGATPPGMFSLVRLQLLAETAARDPNFAATLAEAAAPSNRIEQGLAQLDFFTDIIVRLKATIDHPNPRLRATLKRLADEVAALGKEPAHWPDLLAEAAAAAAAAVAAALARLDAAEGMSSIRPAAGYTQKELAALLDVEPRTWRRWELGQGRPRVSSVQDVKFIAARLAADAEAASPGVSRVLALLDAAVVAKVAAALPSDHMCRPGRGSAFLAAGRRLWSRLTGSGQPV